MQKLKQQSDERSRPKAAFDKSAWVHNFSFLRIFWITNTCQTQKGVKATSLTDYLSAQQ